LIIIFLDIDLRLTKGAPCNKKNKEKKSDFFHFVRRENKGRYGSCFWKGSLNSFLISYSNLNASIGLSFAAFLAGRIQNTIPVSVVIRKVVIIML